jgi:site-specific DNA-methyltransferase (adenine-specific)
VESGKKEHPTQKPLSLMKKLVCDFTDEGDTVFDPFMGAGTTGVACMMTGRNFIGCEKKPDYYAISERRIKAAAAQPGLFDL